MRHKRTKRVDFNGHVVRNADGYEGAHAGFGFGERNDEGRRLLELLMQMEW